uniref:Transposase domain protein n=1 Tax=Rhizobium rhizogenes TaxID=359 RepID=A0A7S4ZRC9_RHIRH|nr:transposase domain protein [Rhizobium rhizogenes]
MMGRKIEISGDEFAARAHWESCSAIVGMGWFRTVGPQLRFDPSIGNQAAELDLHLLAKAIDSLRIDRPSVTSEQELNATITIAQLRVANIPNLQLHLGLLAASRLVDIQRGFTVET